MDQERLSVADQLALTRYAMPEITDGAVVMWYPTAVPNKKRAELAWVRSRSQRGVNLYTSTGRRIDTVRHISDPRLQLNADQRENGAWDFVEDYKTLQNVVDRLEEVERQVTKLITGGAASAQPRKRGRPRKNPESIDKAVSTVVDAANNAADL